MCGKEIMLITESFRKKFMQGKKQEGHDGPGSLTWVRPSTDCDHDLIHSHTMTPFDAPGKQAITGEIACNKQFLLFPQSFLPVWRTFCHFR